MDTLDQLTNLGLAVLLIVELVNDETHSACKLGFIASSTREVHVYGVMKAMQQTLPQDPVGCSLWLSS